MVRLARSASLGVACLLGVACAHRVEVAVPASPAISVEATRFAVIASERACARVAAGLVEALGAAEGMEVDPGAPVKLRLSSCGRVLSTEIDVEVLADGALRRARVQGRAHALATVEVGGEIHARLIGSSREAAANGWGDTDVFDLNRRLSHELDAQVAIDLLSQISPLPRQVERRIYPNADTGSARGLYSDAVRAEQRGELREAARLAQAATSTRPSRRFALYTSELERRLALLEEAD